MSDLDDLDLHWSVPWNDTAKLTMKVFADGEGGIGGRWIFYYLYRRREDRDVLVVNETTLIVEYVACVASAVSLAMHVIFPSRLGQQYLYGIDVSPGAKTYLEFNYVLDGERFRLDEIVKGASTRLRLDDAALMQSVNFPWPVPDSILLDRDFGRYRVPYMRTNGELCAFEFPRTLHRTST